MPMSDSMDVELATAALLGDTHDVRFLLKLMARQLAGALGSRVHVERAGGLFRKSEDVKVIRVGIGSDDYSAEVRGGSVEATVGHNSGGIRIRTETVGLEEWLQRLLGALKAEAAHNQAARMALESLVMGGPT